MNTLWIIRQPSFHDPDYEYYIKAQRYTEVLLVFFLTLRGFSFLELWSPTSSLMDAMYRIFLDIRIFLLVMMLAMISFASCFYLIA